MEEDACRIRTGWLPVSRWLGRENTRSPRAFQQCPACPDMLTRTFNDDGYVWIGAHDGVTTVTTRQQRCSSSHRSYLYVRSTGHGWGRRWWRLHRRSGVASSSSWRRCRRRHRFREEERTSIRGMYDLVQIPAHVRQYGRNVCYFATKQNQTTCFIKGMPRMLLVWLASLHSCVARGLRAWIGCVDWVRAWIACVSALNACTISVFLPFPPFPVPLYLACSPPQTETTDGAVRSGVYVGGSTEDGNGGGGVAAAAAVTALPPSARTEATEATEEADGGSGGGGGGNADTEGSLPPPNCSSGDGSDGDDVALASPSPSPKRTPTPTPIEGGESAAAGSAEHNAAAAATVVNGVVKPNVFAATSQQQNQHQHQHQHSVTPRGIGDTVRGIGSGLAAIRCAY